MDWVALWEEDAEDMGRWNKMVTMVTPDGKSWKINLYANACNNTKMNYFISKQLNVSSFHLYDQHIQPDLLDRWQDFSSHSYVVYQQLKGWKTFTVAEMTFFPHVLVLIKWNIKIRQSNCLMYNFFPTINICIPVLV